MGVGSVPRSRTRARHRIVDGPHPRRDSPHIRAATRVVSQVRTSTFESEVRREQLLAQRLQHELNNALEHELVSTAAYRLRAPIGFRGGRLESSAARGTGARELRRAVVRPVWCCTIGCAQVPTGRRRSGRLPLGRAFLSHCLAVWSAVAGACDVPRATCSTQHATWKIMQRVATCCGTVQHAAAHAHAQGAVGGKACGA